MAGTQGASPREEVQKYSVKITTQAYDILVDEGLIDAEGGVTMFDVQKAVVQKEEEGEITSSAKTQLAPIGDNKAGTIRFVNGVNQSVPGAGGSVGFGSFIGTFSGSADFFRTGSGFEVFHFTHFSGALSASAFEVGQAGSSNYGRTYIGAPTDLTDAITASLGNTPAGQPLIPKTFSGSFISSGFHTAESGSASGSRIFGNTTSSNTYIPDAQGEYNAKWVSGSFTGMGYTSSLGSGTLFTSSAVTTDDLNNMSSSNFVGSICAAIGGFEGTQRWATRHQNNHIFNGGDSLDATCELGFTMKSRIGGEWRNSGSLIDNNDTGAVVLGLVGGTIFALAPSGSAGTAGSNICSGSIESIRNGGYVNRGPGKPYVNGGAKSSYFSTKRVVQVSGSSDKYQKDIKKTELTTKFQPR